MLYTIQNEALRASISSTGGELVSLVGSDGTEYMWQRDPQYWSNSSPHLFPYVGRLTNGKYTLDGETHEMEIHGFFNHMELEPVEQTAKALVLRLSSSVETLAVFPRRFAAEVGFELCGATLRMSFRVENRDDRIMYFGYGEHPGFRVPLKDGLNFEDYFLEFAAPSTPTRLGVSPTCFMQGEGTPFVLTGSTVLPLKHDLFDDDAILLSGASRAVTLRSRKDCHAVTVRYPQLPYLGLWHAPRTQAPYVCIEPWASLPSRQDVVEAFESQPSLIKLNPDETYTNKWEIEIA